MWAGLRTPNESDMWSAFTRRVSSHYHTLKKKNRGLFSCYTVVYLGAVVVLYRFVVGIVSLRSNGGSLNQRSIQKAVEAVSEITFVDV